jgi:hypothetical protein
MRKLALISASALVLALGVASASAQPSGQQFLTRGATQGSTATVSEGRAAALDVPAVETNRPHAGR